MAKWCEMKQNCISSKHLGTYKSVCGSCVYADTDKHNNPCNTCKVYRMKGNCNYERGR